MMFRALMPLTPDDDAPVVRVDAEVAYYPGHRGQRDRYGAPLEPDTPEELEIMGVEYNGQEVDFRHAEDDLIKQAKRFFSSN